MTARLEAFLFAHRRAFLVLMAMLTVLLGQAALRLELSAGFDKQLPAGHEFIRTFVKYADTFSGANQVIVAVEPRRGGIWTPDGIRALADAHQAMFFLPGIDRRTVMSLWSPAARYTAITEEGFKGGPLIDGDITRDNLTASRIAQIRDNARRGGYIGSLVAADGSAALISAQVAAHDAAGRPVDLLALGQSLEKDIRQRFETPGVTIRLIGFTSEMSEIARQARNVAGFFLLAGLFTTLAVYLYAKSWRLTLLTIFCSAVSVVWQLGALRLAGYGLDPLAMLIPFLVFSIGVSHGVQQVNVLCRQIAAGHSAGDAARSAFRTLLVPGTLALATALTGFVTLLLVPIDMIRELAVTAGIGVGFKIISNLFLLPVLASYLRFDARQARRIEEARLRHSRWLDRLSWVARPRNARLTVALVAVAGILCHIASLDRQVGDVRPGTPQLRADSRYNLDAAFIAGHFNLGLDILTVIAEGPRDACTRHDVMTYLDRLGWRIRNVPGVVSVASAATLAKEANAGWNEGYPGWTALPVSAKALANDVDGAQTLALANADCTALPLQINLADHRAATIDRVVAAIRHDTRAETLPGITIRLASGSVGVIAAINDVLERSEGPMLMYVYAVIVLLVLAVYRDWRAALACCLPLTIATQMGYALMQALSIGLTVATLPVMVLATGIGVDYAFYIYNRLMAHLGRGHVVTDAFALALKETGNATIFTALTLAIGVSTWVFSGLKFQADMGLLLAFMFLANMVMAMTALPALAITLETLVPARRRRPLPFGHEA
ncbi:efflux RND transporter permease subunit [Paludibacterium paludis]|uniref:RND transporter n=1 Tax=Paludibacterium paludis TaxID=1225769 RepID=A0A918P510_9NEIS|nr:efflux RND transporter permease subunit [Paludibacterium paludis]GGY23751.1 RND transporter [Paludibacterium paludis]